MRAKAMNIPFPISMRTALAALAVLSLLGGCAADRTGRITSASDTLRAELPVEAPRANPAVPATVSAALAEPAPSAAPVPPEPRIDLLVNNARAREVFLALVADTRYSMLMHPDVAGSLSVTLRGVTVPEALEAIRDVYGYDYKIDGRRITVYAPTLQTRIFTVNYPHALRSGSSDLRITSGALNSSGNANQTGGTPQGNNQTTVLDNSRVSMNSRTDYWGELTEAIKAMLGNQPGRNVITSPQAGLIAVRAMPDELRQVEKFLKAAQLSVERQVMLEAKIVEVELRDGFQSGIDWSGLKNGGGATGAVGTIGGGTSNNPLINGVASNLPGLPSGTAALADAVNLPTAGGGLFGLALATEGFQAVLGFLETRGDVQILSSPRIATLNNQKALLKVGTDDFFITNITGNAATATNNGATATTANSLPNITLTPFFSGIALDVTPQIDEGNNITLHIRPSVTTVSEKSKQINLGTAGNYQLPLASSAVNESDTMVRIQDGRIVAIGGLMQVETNRRASGLPGSTDAPVFGSLLGNKQNSSRKKELIVLIKPTIIRSAEDWEAQTRRTRAALDDMDSTRARVIQLDGSVQK